MTKEFKQFWLSVTLLIGTIIGVGIFGVPYAISRVGVVAAVIYFVALGGVMMLQHLFMTEAAMACPDKQRLPGLVGRYVGPRARWIAAVANIVQLWAGMVAYIIVGGEFLSVLLQPVLGGETFRYQIAWALAASLVVYFGMKFLTKLGFVTVTALVAAFVLIFVKAVPAVRAANLVPFNLADVFLPYGVILFSLGGLPAILEMEDVLEGKHERYRLAVVVGSLIGAALTIAFGFIVYGVTGPATSEDTVTGLKAVLGGNIAFFAALLGFLAIMNCFLRIGMNLKYTFRYDFKLHRLTSWLLAVAPPLIIFFVSTKSFVAMISFSGAVFGGISAVMVSLLYLSVARQKLVKEPLGVPPALVYVVIAVLVSGVVYQLSRSAANLLKMPLIGG